MIHPSAPLLPEETIQRCRRLSVPLILDGVKAAGLELAGGGCMDAAILPVSPEMKVVGTALTVETGEGDNFPIHLASYSQAGDGYVMVIDGKGYMGRAYFGDLIMGACQAAGFKGMVVDGCTRDREGNIALGFPVYSRGLMPRGPVKKDQGEVNVPIRCAGVEVEPGDLVMGDSDGVCVIPRRHIETVLAEAEKKLAYEEKRTETIAAYRKAREKGGPLPQLAPQWVLDLLEKDGEAAG